MSKQTCGTNTGSPELPSPVCVVESSVGVVAVLSTPATVMPAVSVVPVGPSGEEVATLFDPGPLSSSNSEPATLVLQPATTSMSAQIRGLVRDDVRARHPIIA